MEHLNEELQSYVVDHFVSMFNFVSNTISYPYVFCITLHLTALIQSDHCRAVCAVLLLLILGESGEINSREPTYQEEAYTETSSFNNFHDYHLILLKFSEKVRECLLFYSIYLL